MKNFVSHTRGISPVSKFVRREIPHDSGFKHVSSCFRWALQSEWLACNILLLGYRTIYLWTKFLARLIWKTHARRYTACISNNNEQRIQAIHKGGSLLKRSNFCLVRRLAHKKQLLAIDLIRLCATCTRRQLWKDFDDDSKVMATY